MTDLDALEAVVLPSLPLFSLHQALIAIDAEAHSEGYASEYLSGADFSVWERGVIISALTPVYESWVASIDLPALIAEHRAALARVAELEGALSKLHRAVCGDTGFASAVRGVSGIPYPWPALDEADEAARAALEPKP